MMAKKKTKSKSTPSRGLLGLGLVVVLIFMGGLTGLVFFNDGNQNTTAQLPAEIDVDQAYEKYSRGVFLLDVRTQEEWDSQHVPGATLIPLDQLENRLAELPQDQEIVVMCRSGNRSQTGRDILLEAGFDSVTSMQGGINQWSSTGYPTQP
jgi:rhodanese-related sulfurtransferase